MFNINAYCTHSPSGHPRYSCDHSWSKGGWAGGMLSALHVQYVCSIPPPQPESLTPRSPQQHKGSRLNQGIEIHRIFACIMYNTYYHCIMYNTALYYSSTTVHSQIHIVEYYVTLIRVAYIGYSVVGTRLLACRNECIIETHMFGLLCY